MSRPASTASALRVLFGRPSQRLVAINDELADLQRRALDLNLQSQHAVANAETLASRLERVAAESRKLADYLREAAELPARPAAIQPEDSGGDD